MTSTVKPSTKRSAPMPDTLPPALAALLEPMRGPTGPCDCHSCFADRSAIVATLRAVAAIRAADAWTTPAILTASDLTRWADEIEKGGTP